jgi:hypothetical protein
MSTTLQRHTALADISCLGVQFWVSEVIFAAVLNFFAIFVQLLVEPPRQWMPPPSESNAPGQNGAIELDPGQFEYSPFRTCRFLVVFLAQLPAYYWHRVDQGKLWVGSLFSICGEFRAFIQFEVKD